MWEFSKTNYTVNDIEEIYREMNIYERHKQVEDRSELKNLLLYQDIELFHKKLGIDSPSKKYDLIKYWESVEYYLRISSKLDNKMKIINEISKIITTLTNFSRDFYFVYATDKTFENLSKLKKEELKDQELIKKLSKGIRSNRTKAEFDTKNHLKKLGIHTTAKGVHSDKKTRYSINLSEIQNDLVLLFDNNRAHFYKEDKQHYIDNLIIPLAILDENR